MSCHSGPYNRGIVTNGLVLYYDVNEPVCYSSGRTDIQDLSRNGNTGTLVNGVGYSANNGGSLVFDGVNDYVLSQYSGLSRDSQKSAFAWVYPISTRFPDYARIINYMPNSTNRFVLTLNRTGLTSTNQFTIAGTPNNNINYGATTTKFTNNNWYHLGWVYDGSTFLCYCNGNSYPITDTSDGAYGFTGTSGLLIGARTDTIYQFSGNIPQVSIYNRALSSFEVQQNFNAHRSRFGL